jgi:hypothetical protein
MLWAFHGGEPPPTPTKWPNRLEKLFLFLYMLHSPSPLLHASVSHTPR